MKKPVILVTPTASENYGNWHISCAYNNAIIENGGLPLMPGSITNKDDAEELVKMCDGVLFSGGDDVAPWLFGETTHAGCGSITPERDELEINLYNACVKYNKPILGICRGIQIINVAAGGTCIQDIPSEFKPENGSPALLHRQHGGAQFGTQKINLEPNSLIAEITGKTTIMANSFHHQACKDVAEGWKVTGRADDGIIEAIENPSMKFALGVQWHPEHLVRLPEFRNIFIKFIEACGEK